MTPIVGITGPLGDQYLYAHTQVDIQGSYRMYRQLEFVASGLNLTNEVFGFYTGSAIYPNQREFYHPTVTIGLRWVPALEKSQLNCGALPMGAPWGARIRLVVEVRADRLGHRSGVIAVRLAEMPAGEL